MVFRMTGITSAAAMVIRLAIFAARYLRAAELGSFTSKLPALQVIEFRMDFFLFFWMPPALAIGTPFASSVAKDNNAVQARMATSGLLGLACRAQTVERMLAGSNSTWQVQQQMSGRAGRQACARGEGTGRSVVGEGANMEMVNGVVEMGVVGLEEEKAQP